MRARAWPVLLLAAGCVPVAEGLVRDLSNMIALAIMAVCALVLLCEILLAIHAALLLLRDRSALASVVLAAILGAFHVFVAVVLHRDAIRLQEPLRAVERLFCLALAVPGAALLLHGARVLRLTRPLLAWPALAGAVALAGLGSLAADRALAVPPLVIPAGVITTTIAVRAARGCALTSTGGALCWGDDHGGALGTGTPRSRTWLPAPVVGLDGLQGMALTSTSTCVLRARRVLCWGANEGGMFGGALPARIEVPTPLDGIEDAVEIGALPQGLWIRRADGLLVYLPPRGRPAGALPEPDVVPADALQLVVTSDFWCARQQSGTVSCRVEGGAAFTLRAAVVERLAAQGDALCGLRHDGRVLCGRPAQISRERKKKITACQGPALAFAQAAQAARRYRQPELPEAPIVLDDRCAEEVDRAAGPEADLQEVRDVAGATELAVTEDRLCVAMATGAARCGWERMVSISEFPIELPEVAGHPVRVFSNGKRSCVLPGPGRLSCWNGPVDRSAQQVIEHLASGAPG